MKVRVKESVLLGMILAFFVAMSLLGSLREPITMSRVIAAVVCGAGAGIVFAMLDQVVARTMSKRLTFMSSAIIWYTASVCYSLFHLQAPMLSVLLPLWTIFPSGVGILIGFSSFGRLPLFAMLEGVVTSEQDAP